MHFLGIAEQTAQLDDLSRFVGGAAAGQATAEISQKAPGAGTNQINIEVIRPGTLPGADGKKLPNANLADANFLNKYPRSFQLISALQKPINGQPHMGSIPMPSPQQVALGDSIFHGQVAGGTCTACHGQDAKGTAVAPNLTDSEWLNGDGSYLFLPVKYFNGYDPFMYWITSPDGKYPYDMALVMLKLYLG